MTSQQAEDPGHTSPCVPFLPCPATSFHVLLVAVCGCAALHLELCLFVCLPWLFAKPVLRLCSCSRGAGLMLLLRKQQSCCSHDCRCSCQPLMCQLLPEAFTRHRTAAGSHFSCAFGCSQCIVSQLGLHAQKSMLMQHESCSLQAAVLCMKFAIHGYRAVWFMPSPCSTHALVSWSHFSHVFMHADWRLKKPLG